MPPARAPSDTELSVSIVIPTWCEEATIAGAVAAARTIADEVIVADGGSTDETASVARAAGARVVLAPRGRGAQLHAGAAAAGGDVLLFLHADAELPLAARRAIQDALSDKAVLGGNFHLRFVPRSFAARLFTWANDVRRRWLHVYYGDSALFVRRSTYGVLGGFRALPIFEDYELVRRIERAGRTVYIRDVTVEASARRFASAPLRTLALWTVLQVLYSVFGLHPDRLARLYTNVRARPRAPLRHEAARRPLPE